MKTFFKSILLVCLSIGVAFSNPTYPSKIVKPTSFDIGMYNVADSHVLKVYIDKQSVCNLKMEIRDQSGIVLMTKFIGKREKKSSFSLDLSQLNEGNYVLVVYNNLEKYEKQLVLSTKASTEVEKKILL